MSICQFPEHQIEDSDYTLSDLSGSTKQNTETPNKYSVDAKLFLKKTYGKLSEQSYYKSSQHKHTKK